MDQNGNVESFTSAWCGRQTYQMSRIWTVFYMNTNNLIVFPISPNETWLNCTVWRGWGISLMLHHQGCSIMSICMISIMKLGWGHYKNTACKHSKRILETQTSCQAIKDAIKRPLKAHEKHLVSHTHWKRHKSRGEIYTMFIFRWFSASGSAD